MNTLVERRTWPMKGVDPNYPCSDGKPMAEGHLQYRWITTLLSNLEYLFRDDPAVCQAPDVYVAFGVEKVERGSFIVHQEGGVFPQVVFEVWSPSNNTPEMVRKLLFYDQHGAEEYYEYNPKHDRLKVYLRESGRLEEQPDLPVSVSERLRGVRFDTTGPELAVYHPDGNRFLTREESERARAEAERQRAEAERQRNAATAEAVRLRELLRKAGIDPAAAG